ncbi:MAG: hypothetical protein IJW60_01780 [Clostridia bacterium]|nr:hypothetical protein [Clostridia bacterium]
MEQTDFSQKEKAEQRLAAEIVADFEERREARRRIESGWLLNLHFYSGDQYCDVSPLGGLAEEDKRFYWQSRRAFNHIAPTIEARLAKLERLQPKLRVRAFSDEDGDIKAAKLATGLLTYAQERAGFSQTVSQVTTWAEICGSAFYKIAWDVNAGRKVAERESGEPVYEGEVKISAVSAFEIYPDFLNAESLEEVQSLIHAKLITVDDVYERFGVEVQGTSAAALTVDPFAEPASGKLPLDGTTFKNTTDENSVILIERYTRPTKAYPRGRLEIVAGNKLLFAGDLPYQNGERGERDFPFVKQDCMRLPACFFGASVVDRLIPVQRAYNAVRNRKHEFLNRLSMGVLTVEDGAVDTDELAEEGLLPGKVLVYRQGAKPPEMLNCGNIPSEFAAEEAWLEKEFALISGVSDLSQSSTPARVTSATGLQLLLSQDDSRLSVTVEETERAVKKVGKQILRLYREFAGNARLLTVAGENKKTQVYYFNASELEANDVQFEAEDGVSPEEKQATILKLYEAGILTDGEGKLSVENKNRILEAFGFGSFENARDISALHIAKAGEENLLLKTEAVLPDEYDEHDLHITEHTRFLLSAQFKECAHLDEVKARFVAHIRRHKEQLTASKAQ